MKKNMVFCLFYLLICAVNANAQDLQHNITGFWKTINEKTLKPECIIAVYPHNGQYFGRIILTYNPDGSVQDTIYNPEKRALGVVGNPYYAGLDIIWGLRKSGNTYDYGNIMDPEKGRVYRSEAWKESDKLIVRGKWFIFWRNQTWPPATENDFPEGFIKPDLYSLVPNILKTL